MLTALRLSILHVNGFEVKYLTSTSRFARVSSHVDDFNTLNKVLTAKLLRRGYRYHKLRKAFSKFYRRHFDIVSNVTSQA